MGPGGGVGARARLHGRCRLLACGFLAVAMIGAAGSRDSVMHSGPVSEATSIHLVLASSTLTKAAREAGTVSLYRKNDPWKRYLASENACPGGERTDLSPARQASTVACLINFARKQRGLQTLSVAAILNGASAEKGRAIGRCGVFAHNPCGGDWKNAVLSSGYSGVFGENLSLASGPFRAPRPTVDGWLNSRPHRENLFRADWREQGLAMVRFARLDDHEDVTVWVSVLGRRTP